MVLQYRRRFIRQNAFRKLAYSHHYQKRLSRSIFGTTCPGSWQISKMSGDCTLSLLLVRIRSIYGGSHILTGIWKHGLNIISIEQLSDFHIFLRHITTLYKGLTLKFHFLNRVLCSYNHKSVYPH